MTAVFCDDSPYAYVTISETALLARGNAGDAIVDLRTRRVFSVKKWCGDLLQASLKSQMLAPIGRVIACIANALGTKGQHDSGVVPSACNGGVFEPRGLTAIPGHLQHLCIEVTGDCNLDCVFCSRKTWFVTRTSGCRRSPPSISKQRVLCLGEWEGVLRDAQALGCTSVLIRGGEPMMRRGLTLAILQLAQNLGFHHVQLWTNATLLDQQIIDRLQKLDATLVVQVVAGLRVHHEAQTGNRDTFGALMENLASLMAAWIPFTVAIPECGVRPPHGSADDNAEDVISLLGDLGLSRQRIIKQKCRVEMPDPEQDVYGAHSATVSWQGDVFTCHNERLASVGNVRDSSLREIFAKEHHTHSTIACPQSDDSGISPIEIGEPSPSLTPERRILVPNQA